MLVAATSPDGRFPGVARAIGEDALSELVDELQRRDRGYLELHHEGAEWPMLAVGHAGNRAVIHLFDSPDSVSLLQGARTASATTVDVLIMDELATFGSDFAVQLETAHEVIHQFARGSLPETLVWIRL